jgi:predicted RNase H-like HicB family nuclease
MKFRILINADEDGVFVATVPSLPGCVSQGATRAEALANVREAIEGYVESLHARGEPIPPSIRRRSHRRRSVSVLPRLSGEKLWLRFASSGTRSIARRHIILRHRNPPYRRLTVPDHREVAKVTLRALIREAGISVQEFTALLHA